MRPTSGALRAALVNIGYPDTSSDIGAELLELKRDRADLVRANLAFNTGRAVMQPPSATLVNEIIANAKEVVELTVERATVAAVVRSPPRR